MSVASELVSAVQSSQEPEELRALLAARLAELDPAGRDALWDALKARADEWTRSDIQRGLALARAAVSLAESIDSPLHRAQGLLALGNALSIGLGEYRPAVECYNQAAAIYAAHGRPIEEAQSQIGKIYALANLGRYDEALRDGERARQVFIAHEKWLLVGRVSVNLAILLGRLGHDSESLALLDQAAEVYQRLGPEAEAHRLYLQSNRAVLLRNLGRFEEAIAVSQAVYAIQRQAGRELEAARAQQSLAVTFFLQGRYNEALTLLEEVRESFLRDNMRRHAVLVELYLSDCLLQLRRFEDVLEKCREVRDLFSELGTRYEVGQAILNEASAYTSLGRYPQAETSLGEARRLFEQEGNVSAAADVDLQMADLLLAQGRAAESLALAQSCAATFGSLSLPAKAARAALAEARAALAAGQAELAAERARGVLASAEQLNLPDLLFPSRHLLGLVALRGDDPLAGLEHFEQAIRDLELLRGRLMVEFRASFVEDKGLLYEDAVEVCLRIAAPARALEFCERAKSQALLDLLAQRVDLSVTVHQEADRPLVEELLLLRTERDRLYRRKAGGEGFGLRGLDEPTAALPEAARILELEKRMTELWYRLMVRNADYARQAALWQVQTEPVQSYLTPGSLLVEYFAVRGRLVVFLVSPERVESLRLDCELSQVQRLLQLFWLNLKAVPRAAPSARAGLQANLRGVLQRLYGLLVEPFAARLADARRLVIVPHASLHYLPFHALFDGQQHLLERWDFSYLPGSSLLRYCRENRPAAQGLLALGHSFEGRLPFTESEAAAVASGWGGQVLLGEQASLERFRQSAAGCRVLHLATHGEFRPDNPLFSGLALADGWLTTLEVFNLRLQASLVTLSACQTGQSVIAGGDELLGLMRSFLAAGAATLVATLWTVEDRSTAELMQAFYRGLASGLDKCAALCQAQRELLRSPLDAWAHPYFWAPFFLVGDDGVL